MIDDGRPSNNQESEWIEYHNSVSKGDVDYICKFIRENPLTYLDDPIMRFWLPTWEKRWSLSPNPEGREKLDKLFKTLHGDFRGTTNPCALKAQISKDIARFKRIIEKKNKKPQESIEKIIFDSPGGSDRLWQIYKAYKRLADKCMPALKTWDNFFLFLEFCKNNIEQPVCFVFTVDFIFIKGHVKGDVFEASW